MRDRSKTVLVGLGLFLALGPALWAAAADPVAIINHTKQIVMTPDPPEHGLIRALADVLDVALAILPRTDRTAEFKDRVEAAKKSFAGGRISSEEAYQDLGEAYKLVSGGKAWEVPEELKAPGHGSIDDAKNVCLKLLDSALSEHQVGRNEAAARDLLSFVILVVTPIQK